MRVINKKIQVVSTLMHSLRDTSTGSERNAETVLRTVEMFVGQCLCIATIINWLFLFIQEMGTIIYVHFLLIYEYRHLNNYALYIGLMTSDQNLNNLGLFEIWPVDITDTCMITISSDSNVSLKQTTVCTGQRTLMVKLHLTAVLTDQLS